ncbi:MAG: hypothetical protein ABI807_15820 [Sporichthyaceae bacterium]
MTGQAPDRTPWSAVAVGSGVVFAASGAVAFGVLAPLTLLGMDLWTAHVTHTTAPPSGGAAEATAAALVVFVIAVSVALVVSVPVGAALGFGNGVLARTAPGRSWPTAVTVAAVVGVACGAGLPRLLLGRDVLPWLEVLTGLVAGAACGAHLRYLAGRARRRAPRAEPAR